MRKKVGIIIIIILISITSFGCQEKEDNNIIEETVKEEVKDKDELEEKELPEKEGIPSPLSGLYAARDKVERRPLAVMLDNHPKARWQAGLKDAEIVYEFPVEAPYTRYLAIYLINDPESLGSIRSARPYFITTALEYDAVYARVGGSEQAKSDIKSLQIADIDGLTSSNKVFWRKNHKRMPHNLYSDMEALRQTQKDKGYRESGEYRAFKFKGDESDISGDSARKININYNKNNSTSYEYDEGEKIYIRRKDGKLHIDEIDDIQIIAKNIIIQETKARVIDNEGRLDVELIGGGRGKYITNGKAIDIKWEKEKRADKTIYYDLRGEEILLNPGITWVQIVGLDSDIEIE